MGKRTGNATWRSGLAIVLLMAGVMVPAVVAPAIAAGVDLPASADTWVTSTNPTATHGSRAALYVLANPARETFLKFNLSAWQGQAYDQLKLRLSLTVNSAPVVRVYKVSTSWTESALTWNTRPTGGTLLATVDTSLLAGVRGIDISAVFPTHTISSSTLALRLVGSGAGSMTFSSSEGSAAPVLRLFPTTTVNPSPTPSATPTRAPTPSPTAAPTPTATAAPTSTPAPTATPVASYYFAGHGTDHGVGLSQEGARGRAVAGQTYDQILTAYYSGVTLAPLPVEKMTIRVLLSTAFVPTATERARVIARGGSWTSAAFPDVTFPANSYLDMDPVGGTWTANVHDGVSGDVIASLPGATDLIMVPAEPATLFYLNFRDSLRKYDLYRGSIRLRVNGSGIMSINIVGIDEYVQGVIPAEMIPNWPIEALKSQAVAARSYGAARIKTTGYYDVVPTSANQVYGGVNIEFAKTNTAAQQSAGIVVWYAGRIANTYFHDTAGGATENNEFAWPSTSGVPSAPIPYLRGIQDVDANGAAYDVTAGPYAWSSGQFTMNQLSNIYKRDARTNVGTITDLTYSRGVSGRLYKVVLKGSGGTKTVNGAIFKNVYNNYRLSGTALKSTLIYLTPVTP